MPAPAAAVIRSVLPSSRLWAGTYGGVSGIGNALAEEVIGEEAAVRRRRAVRLLERLAALQPEVKVVLPREADAAVQLERGGVRERLGVARHRLRGAGGDSRVVEVVRERVRGVPRRGARLFDGGVRVGELVLHGLERTDRAPE